MAWLRRLIELTKFLTILVAFGDIFIDISYFFISNHDFYINILQKNSIKSR